MRLLVLLLALFLPVTVLGKGFYWKVLIVDGYGPTEKAAIVDALEEAVKREYGFFIRAEKFTSDLVVDEGGSLSGKSVFHSKIKEKFKGTIDKYRVISLKESPDGSYKATVKVYLLRYSPPGISVDHRRKIAVYPFEPSDSEVSKLLTHAVVNFLTQSRKFSVLDRENITYYKKEKALILSGDARSREKLKLKKLAGTDYMLVGEVNEFELKPVDMGSDFLKIKEKGFEINYSVDYRVIMFATGQVKYSNSQDGKFFISGEDRGKALKEAVDRIAKRVVYDILLDIYPPVAIEAEGESLIVNVGNRLVSPGMCFAVYKRGKKLYDPYTEEFIGYDEIEIGKAVVTEVKPKFAKARLVEGYAVKGAILRPVKCEGEIREESAPVKLLPFGGVLLPGD